MLKQCLINVYNCFVRRSVMGPVWTCYSKRRNPRDQETNINYERVNYTLKSFQRYEQTLKKTIFIIFFVFISFFIFNRTPQQSTSMIADTNQTNTVSIRNPRIILVNKTGLKINIPKCYPTVFDEVIIDKTVNRSLDYIYPLVRMGGYYKPSLCQSKHKVAILVPVRNREENLRVFLYNIHPFLMRQQLEYKIFVVEQSGKAEDIAFNKGRLFNAGFLEIQKLGHWQCLVFHDVDLLPTSDRIRYSCPILPTHMCTVIVGMQDTLNFETRFGGVTSMVNWQFELVNGYSNVYWGWGGEDDDMFHRLNASGLSVSRYGTVGQYTMLSHAPSTRNIYRHALLDKSKQRYEEDGLTDIRYIVLKKTSYRLYTRLVIDVSPPAPASSRYLTECVHVSPVLCP